MNWDDIPSADEVNSALNHLTMSRAELRVAELDLSIAQAEMSRISPRSTAARIIGVDDESRARLYDLQNRVLECKRIVEEAEASVQFNKHRIDLVKSLNYKRGFN